jgi:hypothetical protein
MEESPMKWMSYLISASFVRKLALLTLLMAVPLWAQHKTSAPAPHASAPAPHASAPAHNSAPSHNSAPTQHSSAPSRTNNAGTMGHTNTNTMGHTNTNTAGRTNTNTMGRTNTNTAGHTNTTNGRPGGTTAGKTGGTPNGGRPGGATAGTHTNATNSGHPSGAGHVGNRTVPGRQVSLKGGGSASIRPNGQIRSVNRNGMQINRGFHGGRTVVSTHNGVRVVSVGHRGGYVQRAYVVRGGHSYYSRTYYYHGVYRTGVYRGYYWGGRPYYGYYPGYYYHPAFYGWAYNPWPAPVYWGWGWGAAPWYGYYGPYYAPYPVYPSAAFWVADFMIAASLQAAYEAQAEVGWLGPDHDSALLVASLVAPPAPDTQVKMSPEVKNALSEEIKITLAAEQAESGKSASSGGNSGGGAPATSNEAPPALDPKFRTFLISSDTSLVAGDDDECPLSQGDVIERTTDKPDNDGNVNVKVVASNKKDCAIGKEGPMSTDDLQEMYNSFREQVKDGMGELAKKQGTGGLPKAPDTGTTAGDVPPPSPDKSAEKSLQDQSTAADQAEADVKQEASSGSGGGGRF